MASVTVLQPLKERGWRRGFANLLRKENGEWWHTRRWWLQSSALAADRQRYPGCRAVGRARC